jgi:plastocyanin
VSPRSIAFPSIAAAVVAAVALILAGPSTTASAGHGSRTVLSGKNVVVIIKDYAYSPDNFTVKAGTTITVTNRDMTQHTLTANNGAFDTGTIQPGQTKPILASKPGTYPYHCAFHAFMTGTIKVVS